VPLRAEGTRSPLFCLHPVGGQVTIYNHLVDQLPADQPVYGLQSRLLTGAPEEHASIEAMARDYVQAIRQCQSHGPYYLLGFSFGGFLATSVAYLLEQQGERVAFVGLVDCDVQWTHADYPKTHALQTMIAALYDVFELAIDVLKPLSRDELTSLSESVLSSTAEQRAATTVSWFQEHNYLPEELPDTVVQEYLTDFLNRLECHIRLITKFQPAAVQSPLFVWWAETMHTNETRAQQHWRRYTSAAVEEMTLAGTHYAVMYPPHVTILAAQLSQHLEASQESEMVS
jgi:thioesterase domain-containing protein